MSRAAGLALALLWLAAGATSSRAQSTVQAPNGIAGALGVQFTTNEPWDDDDEADAGVHPDWWSELRWEGPYAFTTDPGDDAYWAPPNEVSAERPKLQVYRQNLYDYQRKRERCEAEFHEKTTDNNRVCYPKVVVHKTEDRIVDGCADIDFFRMRYGRFCGYGFPAGHPYNDQYVEPIDGVDYCCRLHDWGIWSWETDDEWVEDVKACGMVMCLSQASGFPDGVTELMPDVEEARRCWYDWAAVACSGSQPELAPLAAPPIATDR